MWKKFRAESFSNSTSGDVYLQEREKMNVRDNIEFSIMAWIDILITEADPLLK